MITLANCLLLSALLFATGVFGVVARRNALIVLMSVELMLNGVNVAFVAFARFYPGGAGARRTRLRPLTMVAAAAKRRRPDRARLVPYERPTR